MTATLVQAETKPPPSPPTQLPPHGPIPGGTRLLISGLLWGRARDVHAALDLVAVDDLNGPHKTIYAAISGCADDGLTGPLAVLDRLTRHGQATELVRAELVAATTAGGVAEAVPTYAAQVLAERFRDRANSYGRAIVEWSNSGTEAELWGGILAGGTNLRGLADRLTASRGGEL